MNNAGRTVWSDGKNKRFRAADGLLDHNGWRFMLKPRERILALSPIDHCIRLMGNHLARSLSLPTASLQSVRL